MRNNVKHFLSFTVLVMLIFTTMEVGASISSKFLSVPILSQQKSNWCWAASGSSILRYFGSAVTQSTFAKKVKGHTQNVSANDKEVKRGLANWGVQSTETANAITFSSVKTQINNNRPIYAGISWYSKGRKTGGHAVVIRGFVEESSGEYVSYMDPLGGKMESMLYRNFRGSTSQSRHWDGTLYNIRK